MKIISDSKKLTKKFIALLESSTSMSASVAWASAGNPIFEKLKENAPIINQLVVGIHFYQTDPKFIQAFLSNKKVRYMKNETKGVFHPKLYLFEHESEWTIIIGSANLTRAAFSINNEVVVVVSGSDFEDPNYLEAKKVIDNFWQMGSRFTNEELVDYSKMCNLKKPNILDLSSQDTENTESEIPLFKIPLISMDWVTFLKRIKTTESKSIVEKRKELLRAAQQYFKDEKSLANMSLNQRREIGGLGSDTGLVFGCFGTMTARGKFCSRIISDYEKISQALDEIPIEGAVTKEHFDKFIAIFKSSLPAAREVAGASRLLTLKRPDFFVNINGKNKEKICTELQIKTSQVSNYEDYWYFIVEKIMKSIWWNTPNEFKNNEEKTIFKYRVALLDSIFYTEE